MENLNAENVKKALECCTTLCGCDNCPFEPKGDCYKGSMACGNELMKNTLALIKSQEQRIKELAEDKKNLEYTLAGVMHSVDKWLDGEELEQDEVNRAITMREKTLQIFERITEENASLHASCTELTRKCASLTEENERLRGDTIEEYRQKVNTKMGKHTHLLGKEYVQRILREVKKEMVGDKDV